jgi:hypothetical protein
MKVQFETTKMPAFWASYLINGDASGITLVERHAIDAYFKRNDIVDVVDCADEAHFSKCFDLYGGDELEGDILEYTVRYAQETEGYNG